MTISYSFTFGWETVRGILFAVAFYVATAAANFTDWSDPKAFLTAFVVGLINVLGTAVLAAGTKSDIKLT